MLQHLLLQHCTWFEQEARFGLHLGLRLFARDSGTSFLAAKRAKFDKISIHIT